MLDTSKFREYDSSVLANLKRSITFPVSLAHLSTLFLFCLFVLFFKSTAFDYFKMKKDKYRFEGKGPGPYATALRNKQRMFIFFSVDRTEYRGVRRETWKGLNGGWYLRHLTSDERFPNSPTKVEVLRTLAPPRNDDNYYGQRLQAYFIPPTSGIYTFYATCDSECVFYLSFDEKPENKEEILRIDQKHRTGYDQWDR